MNRPAPSLPANYHPAKIEARWKAQWEKDNLYTWQPKAKGKTFYWLTMLPYPSGNLHIGHWYAMGPSDAGARFKRMQGYNVFFPIGFDAFGLPAENAAIKHNIHPRKWTYDNIARMRVQLRSMGAMWSWPNEIISCDPEYYKWSQWAFLKFYDMGLAYREEAPVDFCPSCNTTLAREQVVGEEKVCERCASPVIKKDLAQWKYRITKYAEELLRFEEMEWPDAVKTMQTNWIGRSQGVQFKLALANDALTQPTDKGAANAAIEVFTTRPDTIGGMTFCVLSPEHPLVKQMTSPAQAKVVAAYCQQALRKTEIERNSEKRQRDGVFIGAYAINPINQERVPIWVADYVLMSYGTGAIMAVPAHDARDFAFAKRYQLRIRPVVRPADAKARKNDPRWQGADANAWEEAYIAKEGSEVFNTNAALDGSPWPKSFDAVVGMLSEQGVGEHKINYRLRDWLISRQRMWGTPIPIVYCDTCGEQPVPYQELPVVLPDDATFQSTGESPLKYHQGFLKAICPKCRGQATRETDTMDTFICSSWYMYAYLSPYWKKGEKISADDQPWDADVIKNWLPIDQYTGGIEHAIMHLLYFRFFSHALHQAGAMPYTEPIKRLYNQGMILGADNEKMSKSRGNVIDPDDLVQQYGADALRTYLMFIGPWDQGGPWNPSGLEGMRRFLTDVWRLALSAKNEHSSPAASPSKADKKAQQKAAQTLLQTTYQTLQKVSADYAAFKYNTMLAALMSLRNTMKNEQSAVGTQSKVWVQCVDMLLLMLAPAAPFITEELWHTLHPASQSIHTQAWPKPNPDLAQQSHVLLVIQINGKVRDKLEVAADTSPKTLEKTALSQPKIVQALAGKQVVKVIVIGNKLVNIVLK